MTFQSENGKGTEKHTREKTNQLKQNHGYQNRNREIVNPINIKLRIKRRLPFYTKQESLNRYNTSNTIDANFHTL